MPRITSPIKWPGGKYYLASWIVEQMDPHLHYVEPYAGGLNVLFAHDPEGVSEVVNDINLELTTFWKCLQDPQKFQEMQRILEATPFSEVEWDRAAAQVMDPVRRACNFFIRCRQSMSGRQTAFTPLTKTRVRGEMNAEASAWITAIDGLPRVHERLMRVVVLNQEAIDVIRKQDGPRTMFYLDPPYLHSTRKTTKEYGKHEMTRQDHEELLETLCHIKGMFILSGYRSELYDHIALSQKWRRLEYRIKNNAAKAPSKEDRVECVWMNY